MPQVGHPGLAPTDPAPAPPAPAGPEDDLVVVRRRPGARPRCGPGTACTPHFDVTAARGRVVVGHRVPPERLDDDLVGLLVEELFAPGWLRGADTLERLLTGVVRSTGPRGHRVDESLEAWEAFYRNTIAQRAHGSRSPRSARSVVDDRACDLVRPGPVLDLGCGFGFLSLRLADRGHDVTACDVAAGRVHLLRALAPRLGVPLTTLLADAARVPLDDGCAETVLVVHLLEHLDDEHGTAVVQEALRCARRRVVVASPLLAEPLECLGQVRTVTLDDLRAWGRLSGVPYVVGEQHGGWLVLDRDEVDQPQADAL